MDKTREKKAPNEGLRVRYRCEIKVDKDRDIRALKSNSDRYFTSCSSSHQPLSHGVMAVMVCCVSALDEATCVIGGSFSRIAKKSGRRDTAQSAKQDDAIWMALYSICITSRFQLLATTATTSIPT